ncbi:MAG: hypothetical protein ACTS5A_01415 [Candidatus Hodgkinia cicadicola]
MPNFIPISQPLSRRKQHNAIPQQLDWKSQTLTTSSAYVNVKFLQSVVS